MYIKPPRVAEREPVRDRNELLESAYTLMRVIQERRRSGDDFIMVIGESPISLEGRVPSSLAIPDPSKAGEIEKAAAEFAAIGRSYGSDGTVIMIGANGAVYALERYPGEEKDEAFRRYASLGKSGLDVIILNGYLRTVRGKPQEQKPQPQALRMVMKQAV